MKLPDYTDVVQAHERIRSLVHRTPVLTSRSLNAITGAQLYFKCENLQKVGAFKFRGACNAVFSLSNEQVASGVCTHSSGNHAAALALAARMRGVPAYIVMPRNAPSIKKKAVEGYGAQITFCEPTLASRESTLAEIAAKTGATEIHPYNNFDVIAGQGTAAKELLEEVGPLDILLCPIGGGGLLSGTSIAGRELNPKGLVIAAEPEGADDAYRSFHANKLIPSVDPKTIADGLLTSVGEMNFRIIQRKTDEIVTVSERGIVQAMRMIWERMKIIVEPSSAVPLAAILENKVVVTNKTVGIILSGGNVDLDNLPF
ncbi:pyridoxal-phosphate dependent enzyme [uncultured Sunxiuqinia sp.]|uniref:pyridoxal-phosphate dependent enzyme n=1 Tax=uncultured Sunxiuqinia sp. TaxID=1573825 RepID=UPI00263A223D|nr:pyridoxal-phosphate dependent enzyme [uncultured Sunxiuqinia sp.]